MTTTSQRIQELRDHVDFLSDDINKDIAAAFGAERLDVESIEYGLLLIGHALLMSLRMVADRLAEIAVIINSK